jgi:hypothetical protein
MMRDVLHKLVNWALVSKNQNILCLLTEESNQIRYALQSWTLEDEAAAQHVCRCRRGGLPLFQTDEG